MASKQAIPATKKQPVRLTRVADHNVRWRTLGFQLKKMYVLKREIKGRTIRKGMGEGGDFSAFISH